MKTVDKIKTVIGKLSRFLAIVVLAILSLLNLLSILLSRNFYQISNLGFIFNKIFNIFFLVVFLYGIYLLIKDNRTSFRLFAYALPANYLFATIYRFSFITHGKLENIDLENFFVYFIPLALIFLSSKLEKYQKVEGESVSVNEPFTPLQYQGIIVRGLANFVDQLLIGIPFIVIGSLIKIGPDNLETLIAIGSVMFFIYLIIMEAIWGQTVGKKLFGIKVMMRDGTNCTVVGAILRNVFRFVDMIFGGYLLAIIVMTLSPKRQRIGDLIAGTVVIK